MLITVSSLSAGHAGHNTNCVPELIVMDDYLTVTIIIIILFLFFSYVRVVGNDKMITTEHYAALSSIPLLNFAIVLLVLPFLSCAYSKRRLSEQTDF